jgi:DNA-directed RNA polymerase specialized sigma24 family protein
VAEDYDIEVGEFHAIARRDPEAFKKWFRLCEIRLKRSLRTYADTVDVEAIVQDTALKVWEHAPRLKPDGRPGFLLRWAFTVAHNAARTRSKREDRQDGLDERLEVPDLAHVLADPIFRGRIQRCREQLSGNPRSVLDARLADEGQHPDRILAAAIRMKDATFRKNLERARRALEKCLRGFGIDVREYLR